MTDPRLCYNGFQCCNEGVNAMKPTASMDTLAPLKQYFGHSSFRGGQEPLVDALLSGRDVLGVMPTGAGKSICYQLPALLLPGLTVVVSPLISLMKDQVTALNQAGIPSAFINSSLTAAQHWEALRQAGHDAYKIIYVAPERLLTDSFLSFAQSKPISLLAVDEAHCVSQWGQDFRPSYLTIAEFVGRLPVRPAVGAFTATATAQVQEDIRRLLALRDPLCITTGFDRPNLYFDVVHTKQKDEWLAGFLTRHAGQSGIIYCSTRKAVEQVCAGLQQKSNSVTRYHAGLSDEERRRNQEDFVFDRARIMVATNAFGMGIDKSNVSFVVHYNMPKNLESYYQEAGRAGRDGERAECILLYSPGDVRTARFLLQNAQGNEDLSAAEREAVFHQDLARLNRMVGYCTTTGCLRAWLLDYFGEAHAGSCGNCGSCTAEYAERDITIEAQKILSAVARVEKKYSYGLGINAITGLLRGSSAQRIRQLGLDKLPTYGALKELKQDQIHTYIDYLKEAGYLQLTGDEYPVLRLTRAAGEVLFQGRPVTFRERAGRQEERKSAARRTMDEPLPPDRRGLLDALKALRLQLAREEDVPAYIVFSNAVLAEIARRKPRDMGEFLEIPGVGYVKAARYGSQFLDVVAASGGEP